MKILLCGYGNMGRLIKELALEEGWEILAVLDRENAALLKNFQKVDLVMDFSHPDALEGLASYVKRTGASLLSGTTGYHPGQMALFRQLGEFAPVLHSANYSFAVALLGRILTAFGPALTENFDVELVEKHHRQKADAPSGTAKSLADALDPGQKLRRVYGREGFLGEREREELGIFSLRGGTAAGEHHLFFLGEDEEIAISHTAASRRIFAAGAIRAAKILVQKAPGYYSLDQILFPVERTDG